MAGCIVQVWFDGAGDDPTSRTKSPFVIVETEFADFAGFCEAVARNVLIGGAVLWTRFDRKNREMIVRGRRPIAFHGKAVLRAELPDYRYVEGSDT